MSRRLYFVLPDVETCRKVVQELLLARVQEKHLHFLGKRGIDMKDLPEASTIQAIELMRTHKLTALPVVRDGKLVGLVTEHDFFELTASLMLRWLKED